MMSEAGPPAYCIASHGVMPIAGHLSMAVHPHDVAVSQQ